MIQQFRSNRFAVTMAVDAAAWLVGYVIFTWLRFDGMATDAPWSAVGLVAFGTIGLYLIAGIALQLFQGRARVASLDEMLLLGTAIGAVGALVALANLVVLWVPRSIPAGASLLALVLAAWARASWRRLEERDAERQPDGLRLTADPHRRGRSGRR